MALTIDGNMRQRLKRKSRFDDDEYRFLEDKRARYGPNPHGINAAMLSGALSGRCVGADFSLHA